jgi:hypothetical protein
VPAASMPTSWMRSLDMNARAPLIDLFCSKQT